MYVAGVCVVVSREPYIPGDLLLRNGGLYSQYTTKVHTATYN